MRANTAARLPSRRRVWHLTPLVVLGLTVLAGCGSSSSSSSSSSAAAPASTPAQTTPTTTTPAATGGTGAVSAISLAANPEGQLKFNKTSLTAKAGKVTIAFTNNAPLPHNVTIESNGTPLGATPTFQGGSKALIVSLKPGSYKFYCSVPGHRQAGMEGTLTVQ